MNAISTLLGTPLAQAIGWALLHLLWQGVLVAAILAATLALLSKQSANARYLASCGALVVLVVLVNRRLENSHIGRAWEAIREDELAARAMGVPLVRMKLLAFACGASFAGVMGVLFSAKQVFINPESFTFLESIGVLAMVILGGMGSIPGAVLGATVVTVLNLQVLKGLSLWLNELKNAGVTVLGYSLADLPTQFEPAKYERMIFGIILVLMMIFRPQGILPARRRQRELAHLER